MENVGLFITPLLSVNLPFLFYNHSGKHHLESVVTPNFAGFLHSYTWLYYILHAGCEVSVKGAEVKATGTRAR